MLVSENPRHGTRRTRKPFSSSISPFSLPLEKKVYMPKIDPFEGLFGVFADSLPDAWGNLLLNRILKEHGIEYPKQSKNE